MSNYVTKSVRILEQDLIQFDEEIKILYGCIPSGIFSEYVRKCIQNAINDIDFYKAVLFNDYTVIADKYGNK